MNSFVQSFAGAFVGSFIVGFVAFYSYFKRSRQDRMTMQVMRERISELEDFKTTIEAGARQERMNKVIDQVKERMTKNNDAPFF